MKRTLSTIAFITVFTFAAQAQKAVTSTIEDVTVFLNSAQVHRQAGTSLKPGENEIVFKGLPAQLMDQSVQVKGNSDFTILSVKTKVNYLSEQEFPTHIKNKQDSLKDLQFKLSMRQSLEQVYRSEREMIMANKNVKGDQSLLVEDLEEAADYFRERLTEIEYKLLELNEDQKEINKEVQNLQRELNNLMGRFNRNTKEVTVKLDAKSSVNTRIDLTYVVSGARWIPSYDIRSEDVNSPVKLSYKARVQQSTGVDWENVDLTLSTGNPTIGGQKPELNPWYLYVFDPEKYGTNTRSEIMYSRAKAETDQEALEDVPAVPDLQTGNGQPMEVSQTESLVATEFKISVPYTIPSDNQFYDVAMKEISMDANYKYFTVPKLDDDAFLVAEITDWQQYSLLPGQSNIYYQGTYVGNAFIDPAVTSDTLALSMGRDESVVVERKSIKDFSKTQFLGGKKETTRSYEITIVNNKSKAIEIQLVDQIPLTRTAEVEITTEELSGGKVDAETGEVTWKINLEPGEKAKRTLRFTVKYPKKKSIGNL
ncbi:DUF4139 domain-containing protein [Halocola ammonii]